MSSKDNNTNSDNNTCKLKRINLTIGQKLELLEKLANGASVAHVCAEYGVKKQTVSDIKRKKEKLLEYKSRYSCDMSVSSTRKKLKMATDEKLDEAVLKWFVQMRSAGITVRSPEVKEAALRISQQINPLTTFRASDGWIWRFYKRHGISVKNNTIESISARNAVEPFRKYLNEVIHSERLSLSQVYNLEETGLFWCALPETIINMKKETSTPGRKKNNQYLSTFLCSNANGTHRLKSVIIGKSRNPRPLKDLMQELPVHYYCTGNIEDITLDWFLEHFVSEVRCHQVEKLKMKEEDVKAILLLDSSPCYPDAFKLVSKCGKIKAIFFPANISSLVQPMEQGIIFATKRLYRLKFLSEVMGLSKKKQGRRSSSESILTNLKKFNIKSAVFFWAEAWNEVKKSILENGWKKLLSDIDVEFDFLENETSDFLQKFMSVEEKEMTLEAVSEWLEMDEGDPGYQTMITEFAETVMTTGEDESDEEIEEAEKAIMKTKLNEIRTTTNILIDYIENSDDMEMKKFAIQFKDFRNLVEKKQNEISIRSITNSDFIKSEHTFASTSNLSGDRV